MIESKISERLRELLSYLPRRNASSESRGMIKLDNIRPAASPSRTPTCRSTLVHQPARHCRSDGSGRVLAGRYGGQVKFQRGLLTCLLFFAIVGCTEYTKISSTGNYHNLNNVKIEKYLVDTNDILDITVFDEPKLSAKARVSEEGILSYPLIEDIKVKGLTIQAVEGILEERLRDGYLKDPKVTVMLDIALMERHRDKEIFVMGEVRRPGAIQILGKNLSVLEVVTKAGGFTEFAAPNRTRVIRIEEGEEKAIMVNLNKVKKGNRSLDIILKPGDVVVVPESYM
ncbi:MAG: polysaccharide biosynthesis/export family protein [Candidatus Scalinduaceae bacterium]